MEGGIPPQLAMLQPRVLGCFEKDPFPTLRGNFCC